MKDGFLLSSFICFENETYVLNGPMYKDSFTFIGTELFFLLCSCTRVAKRLDSVRIPPCIPCLVFRMTHFVFNSEKNIVIANSIHQKRYQEEVCFKKNIFNYFAYLLLTMYKNILLNQKNKTDNFFFVFYSLGFCPFCLLMNMVSLSFAIFMGIFNRQALIQFSWNSIWWCLWYGTPNVEH